MRWSQALAVEGRESPDDDLEAMRRVVKEAGGTTVGEAAVFTEGDKAQWQEQEIVAVGHLPVFKD